MAAKVHTHQPKAAMRMAATTTLGAMLLITGCAAGVHDQAAEVVRPAAPVAVPMPGAISGDASFQYEVAAGGVADMVVGSPGEMVVTAESGAGMEVPMLPADREIIVTGNAELAADDPVATSGQIAAYVESIGGNVASRNEWRATPTSPGGASLSLRIPAGRLNSVIDELNNFGQVRSTWLNQWDVTEQAVDLDARINALQTSVTRLTELMANAADTSDLLNVERELSRRQADLDALRAQRADLTNRVQMSTLDLSIVPTPTAVHEADPYQGFGGGLAQGWRALVSFARGLAVVLGAILPWLIALGALAAVVVPLVKWWRKRRGQKIRKAAAQYSDAGSASGPVATRTVRSAPLYHDDDD